MLGKIFNFVRYSHWGKMAAIFVLLIISSIVTNNTEEGTIIEAISYYTMLASFGSLALYILVFTVRAWYNMYMDWKETKK